MRTWLLRGGVLAVVHACAQTIMAAFEVNHPTSKGFLAAIVLGGLVAIAAVWPFRRSSHQALHFFRNR